MQASLLKNKGSLLASVVSWTTFNIHVTFIMEKVSWDDENILHTIRLKQLF